MSDPRMMPQKPPMGGGMGGPRMGGPPMGGPKPGGAYEKNRSMLNPTDMAGMATRGEVGPNMTVRELFEKNGVDVDGPISQLAGFMKKQVGNADPMTKMQNVARDSGGGFGGAGATRPMGGPPQGQPPQGLAGLAKQLGG